jgi:hypothetical protein
MDDKKYFSNYKKACDVIFASHTTEYSYLKDIDLKYQSMTEGMLSLIGAQSINEVINRTNAEIALKITLPCSNIDEFHAQDLSVIKNKKRGAYLEILPNTDEAASDESVSRIMVIYKTPIINHFTQSVIGIHGQISDLLWPNVIKTIFKLRGTKGLLLNHSNKHNSLNDYPINNIQHMVLFLCIHNYSYSEIAIFLNAFGNTITSSRVNDYLEQLKLIFHVRTKDQLIEKAIGLNFHVMLPCDLFNNSETIKINTETASVICCNCKIGNCLEHNHIANIDEQV